MSKETSKLLKYILTDSAIEKAKKVIDRERSGEQLGLYSRFKSLNRGVGKYFRFNQVYLLAGRSGSGKSAISTMLRNDFLNISDTRLRNTELIYLGEEFVVIPKGKYEGCKYYPHSRMLIDHDGSYLIPAINAGCKFPIMSIHIGPEMPPEIDLIRSASSIVGKSYMNILSSEYNYETDNYHLLTDEEFVTVEEALDSMAGRKEYYVPVTGNISELARTVEYAVNSSPNHKPIITLDHSLLVKKMMGQGDGEVIESVAFWAMESRELYEAMVIILNQFNNEIEGVDRLKPNGHYPRRNDVYYGGKIWNAADTVILWHRPEQLSIAKYGPNSLDSKNLIHGYLAKSRHGKLGHIWLKAAFEHGRIIEANRQYFS